MPIGLSLMQGPVVFPVMSPEPTPLQPHQPMVMAASRDEPEEWP